jgi:hypothetical protein
MINRLLTVAALASALFALAAVPADAATGRLTLRNGPDGPVTTLINPAKGCHPMLTFTIIMNRTNVPVTVYSYANCSGPAVTVPPGTFPSPLGETFESLAVPA